MYDGYAKLFSSIITSTIWQEPIETKIVWITMLALKDKDGIVSGSIPGLAHIAGVSVEKCEEAIDKFKSPDAYSRSKEYDGRRIEDMDGGWIVLNAGKYRDKREPDLRKWQNREAKRRERERQHMSAGVSKNDDSDDSQPMSAHTDTDTDSILKGKNDDTKKQKDEDIVCTSHPDYDGYATTTHEQAMENLRKAGERAGE